MKAVIHLDVPEYQIGQPVTVFFKDTMCKRGVCKAEQEIVLCNDCVKRGFDDCPVNGWMPNKTGGDWFCASAERRTDDARP